MSDFISLQDISGELASLRADKAALQRKVKELEKLCLLVADGTTYDSEYDGRMGTYCSYCKSGGGWHDIEHDGDCPTLKAREILGDRWPVAEPEPKPQYIFPTADEFYHAKVTCEICGKRLRETGLSAHKKESPRCLAIRKALNSTKEAK